jgi:hypothetical protein
MNTSAELQMIWEYEVVDYLKVLSWHPPRCPEKNCRKIIQETGVVCWSRYSSPTSVIQTRSVTV